MSGLERVDLGNMGQGSSKQTGPGKEWSKKVPMDIPQTVLWGLNYLTGIIVPELRGKTK